MAMRDLLVTRVEEFESLFDELEDIENLRTGLGEDAIEPDARRRDEIERRLLALLAIDLPAAERRRFVRVPCDLWVEVRAEVGTSSGAIVDIGAGGALVETELKVQRQDHVDLVVERQPGLVEHGINVRGTVAWTGADSTSPRSSFGVAFSATQPGEHAHLRRLVLALLRKRLEILPASRR